MGRPVRRSLIRLRTRSWPAHSRLFIAQEGADWVLAYEARQLRRLAERVGIAVGPERWATGVAGQSVFHESHFTLLLSSFERNGNNLGVAYFHGRPGTPGFPEFDVCFERLSRRHVDVDRVQVTSQAMRELVLETGIAPEKLHLIPIGIDVDTFRPTPPAARAEARRRFDLPETAFVVGSFQKDGVGWGEGLEPKLIKGPDTLLAAAAALRERLPDLWFLLTGPSRGYVRAGLERLGIPYRHTLLPSVDAMVPAYDALDVYLVASREEGGPRAVLESMATGIPLVTTRVGQAEDLVEHGTNGFLVEVEDAEGLASWALHVAESAADDRGALRAAGMRTAQENSYEALTPRWQALLDGFVAQREA